METVVELPETWEKPSLEIQRSRRLRGALSFPGDAHQSMLAVGIAALGPEPTRFENFPAAPWFRFFRSALEGWGATFQPVPGEETHWLVSSGGGLRPNPEPIEVRHELAALILAGIGAGAGLEPVLRLDPDGVPGDVAALLRALYPEESAGPAVGKEWFRPRALHRKARNLCKPHELGWDGALAKIALVFHHVAAGQVLELQLTRPGSDLLENLLRHFEIDVKVERDDGKEADELTRRIARQLRAAGQQEPITRVRLPAGAKPKAAFIALAGDVGEASVAALAATVIKGSDILLENVLMNAGRGGFFSALRRMGADIEAVQRRERQGETFGTWRVRSSDLLGKRFDATALSECRDEIFLLLTAAAVAEGESVFRDLGHVRPDCVKDFIASLKRIGVEIGEFEEGLVIRGKSECDGGAYDSLGHPGLAAAYAVLGLKSHGASSLAGFAALEFRYPGLLGRLESSAAAEKTA